MRFGSGDCVDRWADKVVACYHGQLLSLRADNARIAFDKAHQRECCNGLAGFRQGRERDLRKRARRRSAAEISPDWGRRGASTRTKDARVSILIPFGLPCKMPSRGPSTQFLFAIPSKRRLQVDSNGWRLGVSGRARDERESGRFVSQTRSGGDMADGGVGRHPDRLSRWRKSKSGELRVSTGYGRRSGCETGSSEVDGARTPGQRRSTAGSGFWRVFRLFDRMPAQPNRGVQHGRRRSR